MNNVSHTLEGSSARDGGLVFVLHEAMNMSGVVSYSMRTARALNALGHAAHLLTHTPTTRQCPPENLEDVTIIPTGCPRPHPASVADLLAPLAAYVEQLPCVFIPNCPAESYALQALLSLGQAESMRIIGIVHSDDPVYYDWLPYYEHVIHAFVAPSEHTARRLGAAIPHRADDIFVRPCGVDVPDRLERVARPGPLRLIYAGRLVQEQKQVLMLPELVRRLDAAGVDFVLDIVGSGPDEAQLRARIERLSRSARGRVSLKGPLPPDRMADVYRAHEVFVLISEYEGTSLVTLEAMAQGCVPVVMRARGMPGYVRDGENGFTVPFGAVDGLTGAIGALSEDRARLGELSRAAHETVRKSYDVSDHAAWLAELADVCRRMPPRVWPVERPLYSMREEDASRFTDILERARPLADGSLPIDDEVWLALVAQASAAQRRRFKEVQADCARYKRGLEIVRNKPIVGALRWTRDLVTRATRRGAKRR
jgi:glycosyltransferase involved in cell wall biosynthesis